MKGDRKSSFRDVGEELDRRLGGLLGEVGATLGEVLNRLDQLGDGEILRERNFETDRGAVRAGIRVRVRVGGFGGATDADGGEDGRGFERPTDQPVEPDVAAGDEDGAVRSRMSPRDVRPIEATILTVDGTWTLLADLPGVDLGGVKISDTGQGKELILAAESRHRRYAGRFDLPGGLGADDLNVSLVNGILELRGKVPSP
jgi:HSP20 family molecular chaperone IbpA